MKQLFEKHYVTSITILYTILGYFVVHPVINAITELFRVHEDGNLHLHWSDMLHQALMAFDYHHWPMAVALSFLSGCLGFYFARSMREYQIISEQTKRFSQIGMNAATITHDLANTIIIIDSFAEIIKEGLKDPEQIKYCDIVQDNTRKINRMIKDIKLVALAPHSIHLVKETIKLGPFCNTIITDSKLRSKVAIDSDPDSSTKIDPGYFERVIWNIIKNADEALINTTEPLIQIKIRKGKDILMSISDNGPGIPVQFQKQLFKLGSTHGKHGGTGIGLYSSKMIVESHKGKIWFESSEGKGTTFFIQLPA